MPPSRASHALHATPADTTKAGDDFMAAPDHPCKGEVGTLRKLVPGVDPAIDDPLGPLRRLGKDRAMAGFADLEGLKARNAAIRAVLRQRIIHV